MKKLGRKHRPYFRMVAIDGRAPRDGKVIEELGLYDPLVKDTDARAILKGERTVEIVRPAPTRPKGSGERRRREGVNPVGDPLFEALRALRRELAAEAQVPPYVIFHDATLREMAAMRPATLSEMGAIPGIGARKLEAYGEAFLGAIRRN